MASISSQTKQRRLTNALFLFPAIFAFVMVIAIPFIVGIYYSFTDWDGIRADAAFVGFKNYQAIFKEPAFLHAFIVTCQFTLYNVIAVNVIAFLLALLVTGEVRGRNLYRAGFFVPNLIGGVVLGYIWQFIFNNILPDIGKTLGLAWLSRSMLTNKDAVMIALVTVNTWQYAGYIMMIFIASMQSIPASVMEAAEVDGATYSMRIRKILIPMMASAFTISLFLTLSNSFKMYDVNYALTNGGPAGVFMKKPTNMSEFLSMNIYNTANKYNRMAEGQAKAVIFFIVLMVISVFQVMSNRKKEVEM